MNKNDFNKIDSLQTKINCKCELDDTSSISSNTDDDNDPNEYNNIKLNCTD